MTETMFKKSKVPAMYVTIQKSLFAPFIDLATKAIGKLTDFVSSSPDKCGSLSACLRRAVA